MNPTKRRAFRRGDETGSTLISVIVVSVVLGLLTITLSAAVINTASATEQVEGTLQSQSAADAGMAAAVVAATQPGNVCGRTVPGGAVPAGGVDATYTAAITCNADRTQATLRAVGTHDGDQTTIEATYTLIAETTGTSNPERFPVGVVLHRASQIGQVNLYGLSLFGLLPTVPTVVVNEGDFHCRVRTPGDIIVAGNVTSSDSCFVVGDVHAGGIVKFDGGGTTILGDVWAAGTEKSIINSGFGDTMLSPLSTIKTNGPLDLTWSNALGRANIVSLGDVTVNSRTIWGSITVPEGANVSLNGGRIVGGIIKRPTITPVEAPRLPGWQDYAYSPSHWPGATVVTLSPTGTGRNACGYFNQHGKGGWESLQTYRGTVVIDARACDQLTTNHGTNPRLSIQADKVVLLAPKFDLTGLRMNSFLKSPEVYFITEDTVPDGQPTCPLGDTAVGTSINGADMNYLIDAAGLFSPRVMFYTPCSVAAAGGGSFRGAMYARDFIPGSTLTIRGVNMSLPGFTPADGGLGGGGTVVETGNYALGTLTTRRDVE